MGIPMGILMASGLGRMLSSNPLTILMGILWSYVYGYSHGEWPRDTVFLKSISYSCRYFYRTIPMGIPMCIPMASGLGRMFSSNPSAIPMGIPIELFLWVFIWVFLWLVA